MGKAVSELWEKIKSRFRTFGWAWVELFVGHERTLAMMRKRFGVVTIEYQEQGGE